MRTLAVIAASIVAGQYFWLSDTWTAYGISMNIQLFMVWALVFSIIPYSRLIEKSAAFIFAISYFWDVVAYSFEPTGWAIALNGATVIGWLLWVIYRPYTLQSAKVDLDYVYWFAHKPDNFTGFIHSLIDPKPLGGYGIATDGSAYLYRHGEFQVVPIDNMPKSMIYFKAMKRNNAITSYLISKVGARWGIRNNCIVTRIMCYVYAR